jgi:chloramphenicol-sensitive protein RarD
MHGALAYALWGVIPAYWKLLREVAAVELVAHRVVWGFAVLLGLVMATGQWGALGRAFRDRGTVGRMSLSGVLLTLNWTLFVWATVSGHLLDASLGYFINPLLSVALGTFVLRERLRTLQRLALVLAGVGVAILIFRLGRVPWASLFIATTFALYGLVRKTARVEALVGSVMETAIMVPLAAIFLAKLGGGVAARAEIRMFVLLVGTGVVTAVPMVLFTSAARRLPLSIVGFLQYLAPTGQFLLAVFAFGEPLARDRLIAFGFIWTALVVFSLDLARHTKRHLNRSSDAG